MADGRTEPAHVLISQFPDSREFIYHGGCALNLSDSFPDMSKNIVDSTTIAIPKPQVGSILDEKEDLYTMGDKNVAENTNETSATDSCQNIEQCFPDSGGAENNENKNIETQDTKAVDANGSLTVSGPTTPGENVRGVVLEPIESPANSANRNEETQPPSTKTTTTATAGTQEMDQSLTKDMSHPQVMEISNTQADPKDYASTDAGKSKEGAEVTSPVKASLIEDDPKPKGIQEPMDTSETVSKSKSQEDPIKVPQTVPETETKPGLATNSPEVPSHKLPAEGATCEGATVEGATAAPSEDNLDEKAPMQSVYHVKWVQFKGSNLPIITQNENGPCPLLAIMNVLLLRQKVRLPAMMEMVTSGQLMEYLGDCIFEQVPKEISEDSRLNYEQNMHDAIATFHKLQTGLDVNVRFSGVSDFEYTSECIVFDLLGMALRHGWLVDPQQPEVVAAVGFYGYNQLVDKIITQKSSDKPELVTEALIAESFLERSASQLTYHGLCELVTTVKEDELCVFFRNNHFSTLYKNKNELFVLVTDQGFLTESNVVWETLSNVEGDGHFVDASFRTFTKAEAPANPIAPPPVPANTQLQVDQDYLVALSLQQEDTGPAAKDAPPTGNEWRMPEGQELSDHELALRLQEEENRRQANPPAAAAAAVAAAGPAAVGANPQPPGQQQQQPQQQSQAQQPTGSQTPPSPTDPDAAQRKKNDCVIL